MEGQNIACTRELQIERKKIFIQTGDKLIENSPAENLGILVGEKLYVRWPCALAA